jgi:hypothetical protein
MKMCVGAGAAWIFCAALISYAEPPEGEANGSKAKKKAAAEEPGDEHRVSLAVARERTKLSQDIYESTLHVMHRYYFRNERSTIPARAMEDIFSDLENESKIKARWIAVNTKAMSIDHEPETDFEKQAAAAIADGKTEFELVEKGYLHSARAIPLGAGCVGCHTGFFSEMPKSKRSAGLVISIPINAE